MAQVKANSVNVAIRVRPLIEREIKDDTKRQWIVGENELRPCDGSQKSQLNNDVYIYDHVFNESSSTSDVYAKVVAPIVNESFHGFNGTILCYGQTSSGKTHTLYGSDTEKGIIVLFADHLFDRIKKDEGKRQYIIKVGLMEIYNEKVIDLWNSDNVIEIQQRDGRVVPGGLKEETIVDRNDLCEVADRIQRQRRIGETRMNKESSRSHTIARVTIESFDDLSSSLATGDNPTNTNLSMTSAVLHFVDLAGSEKQTQTGAEGERFKEAIHINKSLSCLSRVVQQLSENAAALERNQPSRNQLTDALCTEIRKPPPVVRFVNYRDSKLTRLLQSSLSGDAYTSMICNVTPASLDETKSTLNFAKLAKKIEIAPKQNLCSMEFEEKLQELQKIIQGKDKEMLALKRQVENLQSIYKIPPAIKTQNRTHLLSDRRHSLCPELLQRLPAKHRASTDFGYPKLQCSTSEETFLSTEETMRHFQQLTTIRELALGEKGRYDKEIQTEAFLLSTENKKCDPFTPVQTLRMTTSLLRETNESDRSEWIQQKQFLESENKTLKEEASKVSSLEKAIDILKDEKKELENDVMRQIQTSALQLKRQQAEFEEKMATIRSGSEKTTCDIQCDIYVEREAELRKTFDADRVKWLDENKFLSSQNEALKEEASKVTDLQTAIDDLINEKKDIEKSVSQQVQTLQSALYNLQSKLLEQKADFEKELAEKQASSSTRISTDQLTQCNLIGEELLDEKRLLESEIQSLKKEASKVSSLQMEVDILKDEKKNLENGAVRQIQGSRLQLAEQQAEFEKKLDEIRSESEKTTRKCEISVEREAELRKSCEADQAKWIDEMKLLSSQNEALKEEASKVTDLQTTIDDLINEKKVIEKSASQQVQTLESALYNLQSKLSEQKAYFEKELAENQSLSSNRISTDQLTQCDLIGEELLDEKRLLESEIQSLKKEASKVPSLQIEVDILKDEKKNLENGAMRQTESSQLQLAEQQAEFEKKLAEIRSESEKTTRECEISVEREAELRKTFDADRANWLVENKLLLSQNGALKEKAAKVTDLQTTIDDLINEKKDIEKSASQQAQSLESALYNLQSKLSEQKADFEKELAEKQASSSTRISTDQLTQCDLIGEELLDEKRLLESEIQSLKKEASKVSSLQMEVDILKDEKKNLENGAVRQIQGSRLQLAEQQAEFEKKLAEIRSESEKTTRECEISVEREAELRKTFDADRANWLVENKLLLSQNGALKEKAAKVTDLQTTIDDLTNEKNDIEKSASQQVQTLESRLLEQKADFEKKLAESQSSSFKPIMTTRGVDCDLVREEELLVHYRHYKAQAIGFGRQLVTSKEKIKEKEAKIADLEKLVKTYKLSEKELAEKQSSSSNRISTDQLTQCNLIGKELLDEKRLLESEIQSLKKDASKVFRLQMEVDILKDEKKTLENDVRRQIQSSQLQLAEQQAEFEKKLAEVRSGSEKTTRDVHCDISVDKEAESRLVYDTDQAKWVTLKAMPEKTLEKKNENETFQQSNNFEMFPENPTPEEAEDYWQKNWGWLDDFRKKKNDGA